MENIQNEDLRVRKTRAAIRKAFEEMVCEMEYDQITIKGLAERAQINRRTFYLHYQTIDDLLLELQSEIVAPMVEHPVRYNCVNDIKPVTKAFFTMLSEQPYLHERLLCCSSYRAIGEQTIHIAMEKVCEANHGAFRGGPQAERIIFAHLGSVVFVLYRQWVADGKKLLLDDLIDLANDLLCYGMESVMKEKCTSN